MQGPAHRLGNPHRVGRELGLILSDAGPGFPDNYALLFGAAGAIFALSILPGVFFHELASGKTAAKTASFAEFIPQLGQLVKTDVPFRAFIGMRILTSLLLMAAPFYIGFATVRLGLSSQVAVPVLLAMQTVGTVTGAFLYSWVGARSNVVYIRLALAGATLLPVSALIAEVVGPFPLYLGFLSSGLAMSNLNMAYLNWLVGYSGVDNRPAYVGLSNTITALVALATPALAGTIVQRLGYRPLFVAALTMALSTLFIARRYLQAGATERWDRRAP